MTLRRLFSTHNLVTLSAWASKGIIAASQLLGIKLLIDVLGADRYGIYVVLASFAGWIQLMDFGIGNSLQNAISESREKGGDSAPLIAGLAVLLPGLVLLFLLAALAFAVVSRSVHAAFITLASQAGLDVLLIACLLFYATAIGGIAYKIWYAEQKGWWANLFPALAALVSLGLVYLQKQLAYGDFLGVILAYHLPPALLALGLLLWRLAGVRGQLGGALRSLDFRPFLRRALGFFAFAFFAALVLQLDYFIMAAHASVPDLVAYNVVSKLFAMVAILHTAYLNALWPVCTQLLAAGRRAEVRATVWRAIQVGAALVVGFYVVFFLARGSVGRLLSSGTEISLSGLTISLMAGYFLIRVWCDSWAMTFLSASHLTPLWVLVPVQAVLSVGLQLALVRHYGINGIIVALALSFVLTVAWVLPLLARFRILKGV